MEDLSLKQVKLLESMLVCQTFEAAYKQAGITKKTALKYRSDPLFKRAYRMAKRDAMAQVTSQLQQSALEAVQVLKNVMNDSDTPPTVKIQSARTILDNAYKGIELEDLAEQVEEMEQFIIDRE